MPIANLTPHPVTIFDAEGLRVLGVIGPREEPARIETEDEPDGVTIACFRNYLQDRSEPRTLRVPTVKRKFGRVVGVPPDQGVTYIVSLPVLMHPKLRQAAAGPDVYFVAPDTGAGAVRDEQGNIVGVRGFISEPYQLPGADQ